MLTATQGWLPWQGAAATSGGGAAGTQLPPPSVTDVSAHPSPRPAMLLPLLLYLLPPSTCTTGRTPVSSRCNHQQYWHQAAQACVPCEVGYAQHVPLLGREFTVNCGLLDTGGRFMPPIAECPPGSFNDGRFLLCERCSACPPGAQRAPCSRRQDTQCCPPGQLWGPGGRCQQLCCVSPKQCHPALLRYIDCSTAPQDPGTASSASASPPPLPPSEAPGNSSCSADCAPGYGLYVAVLVLLLLLAAAFVILWRQQGHCRRQGCSCWAKHPLSTEQTAGLMAATAGHAGTCSCPQPSPKAPRGPLTPALCPKGLGGLPLQRLLDNADALEELIMLLDPEGKAGGGTRHLAARYGLSATWIDYAYSLRSTRSPLRATLETVAARQPDATLGQLAGLLAAMGRQDALQVLHRVQLGG
ncbi:IGF-like family receptor 1 isoform X2 [Carettochelys insculpta]